MPQEQAENPPAVLGCGFTFGTARKRAAERACEIYAVSLVDRRLLPSKQTVGSGQQFRKGTVGTALAPVPTIPAERFLSPIPLDEVKDWTWATDLQTGQACLVPAPLVYPVLRGLSSLGDEGLGISSGMSWAEAVGRALLKVCRYLTITQLERAQNPYPQANLTALSLSPEGTRLLHILTLEHIDETVTVYDVTGPLQVPTFAICLGDQTVAYGTHSDVAQALQNGFEQAVLYKQLSGEQILVDNLPFVPVLPLNLRGETQTRSAQGNEQGPALSAPTTSFSVYGASQEWPDLKGWLQEVLQMNGWRAFAVPLDHDPLLHQIRPYIVHVLIARA